jgi:hypothetical protein
MPGQFFVLGETDQAEFVWEGNYIGNRVNDAHNFFCTKQKIYLSRLSIIKNIMSLENLQHLRSLNC